MNTDRIPASVRATAAQTRGRFSLIAECSRRAVAKALAASLVAGLAGRFAVAETAAAGPQRHAAAILTAPQPHTTATGGDEAGRLRPMLGLVPDRPLSPDAVWILSYADFAAQLAAVGLGASPTASEGGFAEWSAATRPLERPRHADFWEFDGWQDALGFGPLQVEQAVDVGHWEDAITLLTTCSTSGALTTTG